MKNVYDLIVLGAGSGGLAAAKRAASYGARVAIIEGDKVGGTCVIRGCVPKKLLVYGSQYVEQLKSLSSYGTYVSQVEIDTSVLLSNVRKEVSRLNKLHINLLSQAGVELFNGWGSFKDKNTLLVKTSGTDEDFVEISGEKILIAVGGQPSRPVIAGSSLGWISDDIFDLKKLPKKIVIIGAGFIACEFACILNSLGVEVVQLVRGRSLLKGFDEEISFVLAEQMINSGIDLRFGTPLSSLEGVKGNISLIIENQNTLKTEGVLFATGRKPFIQNLRLDELGILLNNNSIKVDNQNKTSIANIYAIGDVTNRFNLTPVAIDEGRAFADRLFNKKNREINYNLVPQAVFSQPEVAYVGLTEYEAIKKYSNDSIQIYKSKFRPMSQMISKSEKYCFLKLVVEKNTDKVLGVHMLGENSAEIIQMASIAISMNASKSDFDRTMALHPTIAEEFVTMT